MEFGLEFYINPKTMKKIVLCIILNFVILNVQSQTNDITSINASGKTGQHKKSENRIADQDTLTDITDLIVYSRKFIIKPYSINNSIGSMNNVNGSLNFIAVDSNKFILEIESKPNILSDYDNARILMSGINSADGRPFNGGVLIGGKFSRFEVKKQKKSKDGLSVRLYTTTSRGNSFQILINTSGTGNVNATIIRNNPASPDATFPLNFSGYLAPFEQPAGSVENSFF
mgnify:CR=1 FL=1